MAYQETNEGEPTGQIRVFNRGVAIVERITRLEDALFEAYEQANTSIALRKAKTLLLDLSPILNKKTLNQQTKTKYEELEKILMNCEELQREAELAHTDALYNENISLIMVQLDKIIIELRNATHKLGMDFPKGIDPLDAWAEG